jgi:uncharacterized protein (DUF433 family)
MKEREMDWSERIVSDPAILVGKPVIKGTRVSVELLLDRLTEGWTMDDILASYPHLTREDVLAALAFVAELYKEESFVAIGKARA